MKETLSITTYGIAGATVYFGMNIEQWGIVIGVAGIVIGLLNLSAYIWFKWQHLKIAKK